MPEFIIPLRSLRDKSPYTTEILCLEKTDDGTIVPMGLVKGLSLIGEPAVEPLIEALKDKNSAVLRFAAVALGEIKDTRAVEPLIEALKDEDSNVRLWAAVALGMIGDARAVEPLTKALKDENSDVRASAAGALEKIEK